MEQIRIPEWMAKGRSKEPRQGRVKETFVDRNLAAVSSFMRSTIGSAEFARERGVLQMLESRARVAGVLVLVASGAFVTGTAPLVGLLVIMLLLCVASRVALAALLKRVVAPVVFTVIIVLPVIFSFITPGSELVSISPFEFDIAVTSEGLKAAILLVVRVTAMVSLVSLLFLTTGEKDLFGGLSGLKVPVFFVTALFITFRYVLVLVKALEDMHLGRKSRTITRQGIGHSRAWFASRASFMLHRALNLSDEIAMAMASRGFDGRLKTPPHDVLSARDYLWLGFCFFVIILSIPL